MMAQTWSLVNFQLEADNAAAEISGIETDFAIAFSESFSISGSYATMDSEFTAGANAGNLLRRAPENTWSISPRFSTQLASGALVDIVATASYTDEYHMELTNDPRGLEPDVTVVNASIKYTSPEGRWNAMLWSKNITDELYAVHHINGSFGGATKIWAPPQTFGVSINYFWE